MNRASTIKMINCRKDRLLAGTLFVAFMVAAAYVVLPKYVGGSPERANDLLRKAYTNHRNVELRWLDTKFVPYRTESRSVLSSPSSLLLEVQEMAVKHKNESDPVWAQVEGRLELLLGEHEEAVKSLVRAHELSPQSVGILIDLASAHFEQAKSQGSEIHYGRALELLGEALSLDPQDDVVLYNCAVVEERLFLYRQAVAHWEAFLMHDKTSGWAKEAIRHLGKIEEKLDQHAEHIRAPLYSPAEVAAGLRAKDPVVLTGIEQRVEEYSEAAVQDWLPRAYSSNPSKDAAAALKGLGEVLHRNHNDPWLYDFVVSTPNTNTSQRAVEFLNDSIRANVQGNTIDARSFARKARRLFQTVGSEAGFLRAQVEEVVALRQLFRSNNCIATSRKIEKTLLARNYYELLAKMELEQTSCLVRAGNETLGIRSLKLASTAVNRGRLPSQEINIINYQSAIERLKGSSGALWSMSSNALHLFWEGLYPDKRAYPFYIKLADWGEENGEPFLFFQFAHEAAATLDGTNLISYRAMAHFRFGEAAVASHLYEVAGSEFAISERLFGILPSNGSINAYRVDIEVLLAGLETKHGEYGQALERLKKIEGQIDAMESFLIAYQFYSIRANILAQQGNISTAEKDYRRAIVAAEGLLRSVKDERERLQWSNEYGAAYRGLAQILIRQNRTTEALEVWESYRASDLRSFAKQMVGSSNANSTFVSEIANVQHSLGARTAVVYMSEDDGFAVWVVSGQAIEFHLLKTDFIRLNRLVSRLASRCSDPSSNIEEIRSAAFRLDRLLLEPLESRLTTAEIIIEPDEQLASVPFEVLIDSQGRYLIDRKTISYLPALYFVTQLQAAQPVRSKAALVVGVSAIPEVYRTFLRPLPEAEEEARAVGRELSGSQVLTGKNAQPENVLHSLSEADIFHFAGHSVYEAGRLNLVLAVSSITGNSLLSSAALTPSRIRRCRLVVLSACSTQGASGESFHNAQNVVRMILQAEVPDILASRWDIDSLSTTQFMKGFYAQISLGKDIGPSLRQVMLKTRESRAHPYYWAAFAHFGR